MAFDHDAIACSHCEELNPESIQLMAARKTVAQILPTTAFLLRLNNPPVREMIDANVPVALGTDFNPNAPTMSLTVAMNMGCIMFKMTMQEAVVAATINSAASIGISDEVGSIEPGKRADFLLLSTQVWEHIVYLGLGGLGAAPVGKNLSGQVSGVAGGSEQEEGHNHLLNEVIVAGRTVCRNGKLVPNWRKNIILHQNKMPAPGADEHHPAPALYPSIPYTPRSWLTLGLPQRVSDLPPASHVIDLGRDPAVPHAPRRPVHPTKAETRLALQNALRYFAPELHAHLAPEFLSELKTFGHIYMYRLSPQNRVGENLKAFPIEELPARTVEARAIMHMILNNLDPKVAQFPQELVTYGGNGSVFQNWAQFWLTMQYLSELKPDQTLCMYSGHPHGVFPSHKKAPRMIVTNGMVVPNYSSAADYEKMYMTGVSQYGQMTAGSGLFVHGTTNRAFPRFLDVHIRNYGLPASTLPSIRICPTGLSYFFSYLHFLLSYLHHRVELSFFSHLHHRVELWERSTTWGDISQRSAEEDVQ